MESKVNYTLIGLFILLLGCAAIIIPLWLTSGLDQHQYRTYLIYMDEAVDGLSTNSSVKFNGVDVGYVKDVELNLKNTAQVIVLINVKQGIPITTNTRAVLRTQGITGVQYIGLNGGSTNGAQPLVAKRGQRYPVIPASPSILLRVDTALTQLMGTVSKLSDQMNLIFTPQNAKLFTSTLNNVNEITLNMANNSPEISTAAKNLSQASQAMPGMMLQFQSVLQNLQSISNEVKQNPSVVIRGKSKPKLGPGEGKQ